MGKKIETGAFWMFADNWTNQLMEMTGVEEGKHGQEFEFMAGNGDWKTFPGKVKNIKEIIKKLGSDSDAWIGKRFMVKSDEEKKKFIMELQPE